MASYFVSTDGSDEADGSAFRPWRTINHAMNAPLRPGDDVFVSAGTYDEHVMMTQSGSAEGRITLRSEVPGAAVIRSDGWNAISVYANYVTIDGFDVSTTGDGNGIFGKGVHHVDVLNNIAHDNPEAGIGFIWSEFLTIDGNVSYGNAPSGWFSGISVWEFRNITGDTETTGFRTVITNNVSYDNVTRDGLHTDGNGIIIDDFQSTQADGHPNYDFPTLVENNLVYSNGGKGIAVHWSDNVTVRNNTAWHNNQDRQNEGTWRGELSNQDSRGTIWVNNVAVADTEVDSNNTAIGFYGNNTDVTWQNNLTFNGNAGDTSLRLDGGNRAPTAAEGNLLGVNPHFTNVPSDFRLTAVSPAVDAGTGAFGLAGKDLGGGDRAVGPVDIGAYETGSFTANAGPVAVDDSGFVTAYEIGLTVPVAMLLRNDSDPDGDPLSLVSVSGSNGGAMRIDGRGNIVFLPGKGEAGEAKFDYTIADGKGGEATASVTVTVSAPVRRDPGGPTDDGATFSFWDAEVTPGTITDADEQAVELGTRFSSSADGEIVAIRFYRGPENDGPHLVTLWSESREVLAVASADGPGLGWQEVMLHRPVGVTAGDFSVVSYHAPQGRYSVSQPYFTEPLVSGPLIAPTDAGVYKYGPAGSFPDETFQASNYWIEPVYTSVKVTHRGSDRSERLDGDRKDDAVLAGAGNDYLVGKGGNDTLRGQSGDDKLVGGGDADVLVGGHGDDTYVFRKLGDSRGRSGIDEIRAGDGSVAVEGVGHDGGDLIDLHHIDADTTTSGHQKFRFGSQERGGLWLIDRDGATVVLGNTDGEAEAEFEMLILDGQVTAAEYALLDFLL